jgi:hypothetical protein
VNAPARPPRTEHATAPTDSLHDATQLRYARWLELGARASLAVMAAGFALYLSGLLEPLVPLPRLAALWRLPVGEFLAQTGAPTGWAWLRQLDHGDIVGELGVAMLALCSLPCVLSLWPLFRARGDRVYAGLCIAQAAVLVLSASGLIHVG